MSRSVDLEGHRLEYLVEEIASRVADRLGDRLSGEPGPPLAYSVQEACDRLGVSRKTLMLWIDEGRIHRVPGINRVLIPRTSMEEFIKTAFD